MGVFVKKDLFILWDIGSLTTNAKEFTELYLHPAMKLAHIGKIIAVLGKEKPSDLVELISNTGITCVQLKGEKSQDVIALLVDKLPGSKIVHSGNPDLVGLTSECVNQEDLQPTEFHPELADGYNRLNWLKRVPNMPGVKAALNKLGANDLVPEFEQYMPTQTLIQARHITPAFLADLAQKLGSTSYIALDWETWATPNENFNLAATKGEYVDMFGSKIAGMGITFGQHLEHTLYFQFDHADVENNINKNMLIKILNMIPKETPVVIQNAYFENCVLLSEFGRQFENFYDTKIMHRHIDEMSESGLKSLSKRYLNYSQASYSDTIAKSKTMRDYTGRHVFKYGADDPLVTAHLFDLFFLILNIEDTWEFVREHEFPTVNLLAQAHVSGVSLDWEAVETQDRADLELNKNCIQAARNLLKENQNLAELENNAAQWFNEEIKPEFDLKKHRVRQISNFDNLASVPELKWIAPNHFVGIKNRGDLIELFENQFKHFEAAKKRELVESFKYTDLTETVELAVFSCTASALSLLAKSYDLPARAKSKNEIAQFVSELKATAITSEQKAFVADVIDVLTSKHQTSLASYVRLKARYGAHKPGKTTITGFEFNLNSPKQMQQLFYGMLGMPIRVRNFKVSDSRENLGLPGVPQVNEETIEEALAYGDATGWKAEVLKLLLTAKKADTRVKLFYSKFPLWRHPKDGLIHPQFNSVGTDTRRPTGSSPNLLQLSKKGDGLQVRKCFLPNKKLGHDLICSLDWDGEELRIIAGLSGDKELTSCYVGDNLKDVHSIVAAQIKGCSYEEFVAIRKGSEGKERAKEFDNIRKSAKSVVFGGNYEIGGAKLARQLHISVDDARAFLQAKKAAYSGMESWRKVMKADLHKHGYVKTLYGSRKHVFHRLYEADKVHNYERSSVNYLVQSLAADYLKVVLSNLWKKRTFQRHNANFMCPLYDEIIFSCHHTQAVSLIQEVYAEMTKGIPGLNIPMLANPALGINFADQVEILADCNQTLTDERIWQTIQKVLPTSKNDESFAKRAVM
jgi:DNA polymerase I-like protein with 3'-5' exonuclease and polymerase domains